MIFHEKPVDFKPKYEVASCYIEHDGKILLLLRQDHKSEGNKWGILAGKVEKNEDIKDTILREVKEEVDLEIPFDEIEFFKTVYVKYPDYDFPFHMFCYRTKTKPEINLDLSENKEYAWKTPSEALEMDLVLDENECIKLFINSKSYA